MIKKKKIANNFDQFEKMSEKWQTEVEEKKDNQKREVDPQKVCDISTLNDFPLPNM